MGRDSKHLLGNVSPEHLAGTEINKERYVVMGYTIIHRQENVI
jgi:hypothetical protein